MMTRTIAQITDATNERVGPFKIKNVLPVRTLKQVDPFLLIHHLQPYAVKPGDDLRIPPHPHAGFEVVTYLLEGDFFHRDSKNHNQEASGGDINWMTSGSGIIHSEGPTPAFLNKGGIVELLQVWINLPASKKNLPASFRHYPKEKLPVVQKPGVSIKVLIGSYENQFSPVSTFSDMFWYHIQLNKGEFFTIPVNENHSSAIYIMKGEIKILNEKLVTGQLVDFEMNGNQLVLTTTQDSSIIVFGGQPLKEKVVSYGPFVMNSMEEVQQAIKDYEDGKMGILAS
ncbi:MAG: pirin family protein [Chitinophagaceae bacterium]